MTQQAKTLTELRYIHDLPAAIASNNGGLILIGSNQHGGRTSLSHAAAISAAALHGGNVAVVSHTNELTHTNTPGSTFQHIQIAPTGTLADIHALKDAIQIPGIKTIIYDSTPQIGGVAYASALARAGWLILMTLPLDDVEDLIGTVVNCQTIACYSTVEGGIVLAAEDIANALIAVTVQTLTPTTPQQAEARCWFLQIDTEARLQIVKDRAHLANTVGLVGVS